MTVKSRRILIIIICLFAILGGISVFIFLPSKQDTMPLEAPVSEEEIIETRFGLPISQWRIITDTVKQGEYLGNILQRYGITATAIDKIAKTATDSLDFTRISVGNAYSVFVQPDDSSNTAKYFVYENSAMRYTVFDFTDTISIEQHYHDIDTVECTAAGRIETSLWNALVAKGYDWDLALEMSQVWAWTVDFYALQTDNWFKVVYDEYRVDGKRVKFGKVHAGVFYHNGKEQWSIPFTQDSITTFFDTCGMSMRKAFLKAPLKFTRVSSRYTNSRMHPIHHVPKAHLAVDFSAPTGTPIYAASDGRITVRKYGTGAGNYVTIRHNAVYQTVYMHMSKFGKYNVGDYVSQGDVIGYVGSTGWSTGPHLHYEVHENGKKINPLTFDPPPAEPIDSANMQRFEIEKRPWIEKINAIEL